MLSLPQILASKMSAEISLHELLVLSSRVDLLNLPLVLMVSMVVGNSHPQMPAVSMSPWLARALPQYSGLVVSPAVSVPQILVFLRSVRLSVSLISVDSVLFSTPAELSLLHLPVLSAPCRNLETPGRIRPSVRIRDLMPIPRIWKQRFNAVFTMSIFAFAANLQQSLILFAFLLSSFYLLHFAL